MKSNADILLYMAITMNILITSCSTGRQEAREATAEFRERYARREYKQIYDASTSNFKKGSSEKEFIAFMEGVFRKLGTVKKVKESGWQTSTGTSGRRFVIGFDSEFEKGRAKEQFTWAISGKKAKLLGYNINSKFFVTD